MKKFLVLGLVLFGFSMLSAEHFSDERFGSWRQADKYCQSLVPSMRLATEKELREILRSLPSEDYHKSRAHIGKESNFCINGRGSSSLIGGTLHPTCYAVCVF